LILKRTAFDGGALIVGALAATRYNNWFDAQATERGWEPQAKAMWKILGGLGVLAGFEYLEVMKSEKPMGNFVDDVDLRLVGVGISALALSQGVEQLLANMRAGNGEQTPATTPGTMIRTGSMGRRMAGSMGATYLPGMPSRMQGSLMMDRDRSPVSSMQGRRGMRATPSRMQGQRSLI
jgi:hypothetical protein